MTSYKRNCECGGLSMQTAHPTGIDRSPRSCYLGGMPIELKPETEALIQQDVRRGAYQNATDFVEHAVVMLHEQEEWLSGNRAEIAAAIEAGYASAQRGALIDEEQVRLNMAARKQKWLAQSRGRP
jgi:Arc/MetJ-type ribon-helix-helix transcriptional regulator